MDFKPHLDKLKEKGLEKAEETLEIVAEVLFEAADEYVAETETKFDDMAYSALKETMREMLAKVVDKVDGKEG